MSRRIIGVTVGTPISPKAIERKLNPVKTVNGVEPDENGNVAVDTMDEQSVQHLVENTVRDINPVLSVNGVEPDENGNVDVSGATGEGGSARVLLWNNPYPRSFGAESVPLDLSGYDGIEVLFYEYDDSVDNAIISSGYIPLDFQYKSDGSAYPLYGQGTLTRGFVTYYRCFYVNPTGIDFEVANAFEDGNPSLESSYMIPYRIYGFKNCECDGIGSGGSGGDVANLGALAYKDKVGFNDLGSDTLTWDGNTEGLLEAFSTDPSVKFYKVSDVVVPEADMYGGWQLNSPGSDEIFGVWSDEFEVKSEILPMFDEIGVGNFAEQVLCATSDNQEFSYFGMTVTCPEKGVYFRADTRFFRLIGFAGFPMEKIDPSYLPMDDITAAVIAALPIYNGEVVEE